jgi:hypothetical protein
MSHFSGNATNRDLRRIGLEESDKQLQNHGMESSHGTTAQTPDRKPFKIPMVFAPIYIPIMFLAAGVSIPWTYIRKSVQRLKERRFMERMKKAGRLMEWQEFKQAIASGEGTAIGEYLSIKGPFRIWWTPEAIPRTSPHRWEREKHFAFPFMEPEFLPFFEWCYTRYTNPVSGSAQLVSVPKDERNQLKALSTNPRFVSICSYRSLRERAAARS